MPADPSRSAGALFDREHAGLVEGSRRRRRPAPDWGGDELFDHVPRRRFARAEQERPAPGGRPAAEPVTSTAVRTPTGSGGGSGAVNASRRFEPRSRTVEQRIAASPARLAAWAFALGLLLILIAVATSL